MSNETDIFTSAIDKVFSAGAGVVTRPTPTSVVEEAEPVEEEQPAPVEAAAEAVQPEAQDDDSELETARNAMRFLLPEDAVEKASRETLQAFHERWKKREKGQSETYEKLAEANRELRELRATLGNGAARPPTEKPEDLPLPAAIIDDIGPETAKWIQTQKRQSDERIHSLEGMVVRLTAERVWDGLVASKEVPADLPEGAFDTALGTADTLSQMAGKREWSDLQGPARLKALLKAATRVDFPRAPSAVAEPKAKPATNGRGITKPHKQTAAKPAPLTERQFLNAELERILDRNG